MNAVIESQLYEELKKQFERHRFDGATKEFKDAEKIRFGLLKSLSISDAKWWVSIAQQGNFTIVNLFFCDVFVGTGAAKCSPDCDTFDFDRGEVIVFSRAARCAIAHLKETLK